MSLELGTLGPFTVIMSKYENEMMSVTCQPILNMTLLQKDISAYN